MKAPHRIGWRWLQDRADDAGVYFSAAEEFVADPNATPDLDTEDPIRAPLKELNQQFAVVQIGSDVLILQEHRDAPRFLTQSGFQLLFANRRIQRRDGKPGDTEPLAKAWLAWGERRQFARVVFKPGESQLPADEYNLWRGWNVEPSEHGSCDRFLAHLRDIVCNGEGEHYDWLLDWLAHLFQFPQEKPGTAIGLQGGQGAGKSIVGQVLKKLLGPCHAVADKPEHVTGHFNAHLAHNVLLQAEEAFWAGSKAAESSLKHLVTGSSMRIERKGVDCEEMPNYTRLLITSNNDRLWPTALDDRRLAMFRVRDTRAGDYDYFDALFAELDAGGYQRLLHLLLTRAIDRSRLRRAPTTEAFLDQATRSMTPEDMWLLALLEHGEIPGDVEQDGCVKVASQRLYEHYCASLPSRAQPKANTEFGLFVKEHLGATRTGKRVPVSGAFSRSRSYELRIQSLTNCRAQYSSRGRAAQQVWEAPNAWSGINEYDELRNSESAAA
jgi:hypothetical protein